VAVVIPCRNSAQWLEETLRSVQSQSLRDLEVIVVDDGSTDGTPSLARRWVVSDPRFRLVLGPSRGIARSRALGAALASESVQFLAFMDADDLWLPDAVERLRSAVAEEHVGAHALARFIDSGGHAIDDPSFPAFQRDRRGVVDGEYRARDPSEATRFEDVVHLFKIYPAGTALYRRRDYVAVGGHDARLQTADDWDLALRLLRRGALGFLNEVVVAYRRHPGNTGVLSSIMINEVRRVWATTYYDQSLTVEQRSAVRGGWPLLMRTRAREKRDRARDSLSRHRRMAAVRSAADAAAHLSLLIPPPWWAQRLWTSEDGARSVAHDLATCQVESSDLAD
jgi:glycosyltransferase involved in cell wall biosynthesis